MARILRLLALATGLVVAAASAAGPRGYESSQAPGIKLITPEEAAASNLGPGVPIAIIFGDRQNGTELAMELARRAQRLGARYVASIEIRLVSQRDGQLIDCVTLVQPVPHERTVMEQRLEPQPMQTRYVMRPVTSTVTESEYRCHMVSRPHTETRTEYQSSYDFSSHSYRSQPVTRTVTEYRMENECRSEPVTRMVTRYENQLETEYVPPTWRTVFTTETDWTIEELPPTCAPLTRPLISRDKPHQISGIMYR